MVSLKVRAIRRTNEHFHRVLRWLGRCRSSRDAHPDWLAAAGRGPSLAMGYALGAYVAVPNFGLLDEGTIPAHEQGRHSLISALPWLTYVAGSVAFAFLWA